jgi:CheY-like chemotaxis protein
MDGDITVESTVGRGSRFVLDVRLPETAAIAPAEERRVTALAPGQPEYRILVVDDTDVNRTVLFHLLKEVGFSVREAASGFEALDLWRSWEPHLIWMDKRMAGLDGLEVTRRIRTEEERGRLVRTSSRTPIIALSASALDHERGEILAAGCDDFVAKPFRESTIFDKLQQHLGVRYAHEGNVLLVDDDRICREVAVEILRGTGVGVTAVASGREALDLLASDRFDLVFMDLQMPEMGGIEAARRIRANPATSRLPIIAMTAEDERPADGGMDDYVAKPVEPRALTDVLRRWLP